MDQSGRIRPLKSGEVDHAYGAEQGTKLGFAFDASLEGTKEVWGAVFASTITTVAVFLPIVFIKAEAGQLFRDIAIAVVAAVSLSLFVSVSVIPMFSNKLFSVATKERHRDESMLVLVGNRLATWMTDLVALVIKNWRTRMLTIVSMTTLAIVCVWALLPKMEYLPQGNRNFVLSILVPPPGLSNDELLNIGHHFTEIAKPHMGKDVDGLPGIADMFYIGREGFNMVGALSTHWDRAGELRPLFNRMIYSIPGMYGVSLQPGIFSRSIGKGRSVEIDISGDDLQQIVVAATRLFEKIRDDIDETQVRPLPSIELSYPEAQIIPNRERLKANGMTSKELGVALDVLMDGFRYAEIPELNGDDLHIPAREHFAIETFIDGAIMTIADAPWPGLTPDLLSVILVTASQARGSVLIHQKMFESRLFFVDKLIDMGAQIILCDPHRATVIGLDHAIKLRSTSMSSPDIRAGVALLIAAMSAEGTSTIHNIEQIDRGYEQIDQRLNKLGAVISREE